MCLVDLARNASRASASGKTALTSGCSVPSSTSRAISRSWEPFASRTKRHRADVAAIGWHVTHDRDERATRLDDRRRTRQHIAADDVVDEVDRADLLVPAVLLDVDEFLGAGVEHALARTGSTGSDDMGAGPAGERHRHQPDPTTGAVNDHRLAGLEMAVVEQRLPRSEPGLRDGRGFDEVERRRLRRQAAHFDLDVLGGPAVAVAVDQAEHFVADRHAGGAVSERDHDARPLVGRDPPPPLMSVAIGRKRPHQLGRGETGGAHLHERVADRGLGIGSVFVDEAIDALDALRVLDAHSLHRSLLSHRTSRDPGAVADLTDRSRCRSYPGDERDTAESTALCDDGEYRATARPPNWCRVNACRLCQSRSAAVTMRASCSSTCRAVATKSVAGNAGRVIKYASTETKRSSSAT